MTDADRPLETPHCSKCYRAEANCECEEPDIRPSLLEAVMAAQERLWPRC